MKLWQGIMIASFSGILWSSCATENKSENDNDKKKLDASLINNPRSAETPEEVATSNLATMDFTDTFHDFGKMYEGEAASYDFHFTNNGKSPLLISNAAGTCGCTVPEYPHIPVAPGQSSIISVKFNSASKTGLQNKTVNIFTNSNKGTHSLNIKAEVMEKPE